MAGMVVEQLPADEQCSSKTEPGVGEEVLSMIASTEPFRLIATSI